MPSSHLFKAFACLNTKTFLNKSYLNKRRLQQHMVVSQARSRRKLTGGRYVAANKKKSYSLGNLPTFTKIGEPSHKERRTRGGYPKLVSLSVNKANVFDKKSGKAKLVEIKTVVENPANRNFVRRNILTKGAIVETELGKAKITSRPGQQGFLNAVLL